MSDVSSAGLHWPLGFDLRLVPAFDQFHVRGLSEDFSDLIREEDPDLSRLVIRFGWKQGSVMLKAWICPDDSVYRSPGSAQAKLCCWGSQRRSVSTSGYSASRHGVFSFSASIASSYEDFSFQSIAWCPPRCLELAFLPQKGIILPLELFWCSSRRRL